jgi:hypothetical protein
MKPIRSIAAVVLVLALAVSCSPLPQSSRTDEQLTSLRAEYLKSHPDGKFNALITEGRVVKGMSDLEVLASWGLPNVRRAAETGTTQYWAYYAKDQQTNKIMSYELVFESKLLRRWDVRYDVGGSLGTTDIDPAITRTVEETLRLGTAVTSTETAAQKKTR